MEPKVILIANQKGGVGKTMLTDELCFEFDRTCEPYSLQDLDMQGGLMHHNIENPDSKYIVVDTPGAITDNLADLISMADLVIIPTKSSVDRDLPALKRTLEMVRLHGKKNVKVLFVFNEWNPRLSIVKLFEEQFPQMLEEEFPEFANSPICRISDSANIGNAAFIGASVVDGYSRSKSAAEIKDFLATVRTALK